MFVFTLNYFETILDMQTPREKMIPLFQFRQCLHCRAWRDPAEREKCCLNGKNILPDSVFPEWPPEFLSLIRQVPRFSVESRMLNNSCAFVSIGTACPDTKKDELTEKGWIRPTGIPRMYGLFGRTYHYISGTKHKPTAFYMFGCDPNECFSPLCDEELRKHLVGLLHYLDRANSFSQYYKRVAALSQTEKTVVFKRQRAREDEPFVAMGTDADPEAAPLRTFALHPRLGECVYYSTMHRCGEAGAYPLIFPTGQGGWYGETRQGFGRTIFHPRYVSQAEIETVHQYVKYVLYQHGVRITYLGTVAQQWVLDMFSRWQEIVFQFMSRDARVAQSVKLRLMSLKDINRSKLNAFGKKGRPFAIPATVPGSPAARRKTCREAMAVISQLGSAHGWITATCNPRWQEITKCVRAMFADKPAYNEEVLDLPPELLAHIATRVYWTKYLTFLKLLRGGHFSFGRRTEYIQVVHEYQERFFPHFHLLCRWYDYDSLTPIQLDTMFCARLFIYEECPLSHHPSFVITLSKHREKLRKSTDCHCSAHKLHRVVFALMRHTCSKVSCRRPGKIRSDGTCDKRFPREAGISSSMESFTDGAGFFHPKRPFPEDAFVVPYNRLVLGYMISHEDTGYFCFHNNWDQCAGAHTLEYIFEYQHKGPDFTEISVEDAVRDISVEFREYQRLRRIGLAEAIMRFLKMELVHNEPGVSEISVHLENEQFVALPENATDDEIRSRLAAKETPLLRYFWRPKDLAYVCLTDYYSQYDLRSMCPNGKPPIKDTPPRPIQPKYVVRRSKLHVCRLEFGSSMHVERYCLGLILRRFPRTSFQDCRTVSGVVHKTFSCAAYALGIFSEYNEYEMCLRELINPNLEAWKAAQSAHERVHIVGQVWKARVAFATMIMNGGAAPQLFNDYWFYLTRDALTRGEASDSTAQAWLLNWLKAELLKNQLNLEDVGLEDPSPLDVNETVVRDHEKSRVTPSTINKWVKAISQLDQYQRPIFEAVVHAVLTPEFGQRLFYVDARAGCGKTFLCQCISAFLRSKNKIVLTSAPSALAASLHMAGTTCHKCFGLPVTNDRKKRTSSLGCRSYQGTALRLSDLLVIDEFSMLDILNFDCADRICRDVTTIDSPFGSKVVLCCGEFAQLPPVVPQGLRKDIIAASCISHPLWTKFSKFSLHHRWRNKDDLAFQSFCDSLADKCMDGFFDSPPFLKKMRTCTTPQTAVDMYVGSFTGVPRSLRTDSDFTQLSQSPLYRGVVAAYHHSSALDLDSDIALRVRQFIREPEICLASVDTATKGTMMTPEFMEEIAKKNHQIPASNLRLFRGCKVRLLRNFHPSRGLCNGTILIIRNIGRHFIEAQIMSDTEFNGNVEILFRFKFDVESKALTFSRVQFPLATAFAGTVHRFQGHTTPTKSHLLLDVRRNPFCHGQPYVAFSRARESAQVIAIVTPGTQSAKCLMYKDLTCTSNHVHAPPQCPHEPSDCDLEDFSVPPEDSLSVSAGLYDGNPLVPLPHFDDVDDDVDDADDF